MEELFQTILGVDKILNSGIVELVLTFVIEEKTYEIAGRQKSVTGKT